MKRIMLVSILVLIAAVLIGCSNSANQVSNENSAPQPAVAEATGSTPAEVKISDIAKNSGTDIKVRLGQSGENMKLPESYPKEVLPLLEDANIINVNDNKDSKTIGITFKTSKTFDEAIAYYQGVMKDGIIAMENKQDKSYIMMGDKGNCGIMVTISKYDGENISILLNVTNK